MKLSEQIAAFRGKHFPDQLLGEVLCFLKDKKLYEVSEDREFCMTYVIADDGERVWEGRWYDSSVEISMDSCLKLFHEVFPNWMWKVGTCSVSDDAWIAPMGLQEDRVLDTGFDVDSRPSRMNPCIAFLQAMCEAKEYLNERHT
ncbi:MULTISPECIES: hypothetical protein [unclassified Beijerinckia]|uniref:hypothetical protein n=1 Tax=unclassified Beijerinckia TaxID=2638183 RepID=UPI00089AE219|nr:MULTISPECIES: hypothetical protein [unclassified Beijerinckia]MDH7796378.1 hypothetical protein [Beijerinckia sp. GAS462]SEC42576.1 hypothetical protein SAMN05443249_2661 [Beijerinckia sp. 28-YEA-48]